MRHLTTFWVIVGICGLTGAACGPQDVVELVGERPEGAIARQSAAITDGQPYAGHPSVGFILIGGSTACDAEVLQGEFCTATLVGKRTVLLAAHCLKPGTPTIFCLKAGGSTFQVQSMIPHPGWDPETIVNDIGLIILAEGPPVPPSVVSTEAPSVGLEITLIGFGITADGAQDAGTKRIAVNTIQDLWETRFSFAGTGGGIGSTCNGDSGGPAFATLGGYEVQVGVTSAGMTPCGTLAYDTRVDAYYDWINTSAEGDLYDPSVADDESPQVTITAPAKNSQVEPEVTVQATVSDNVGVQEVALYVDGQLKATRATPPYNFLAVLADGLHALTVVATDSSGNQGQDEVQVGVGQPVPQSTDPLGETPGSFGAECETHAECLSNLCANQTFCTQQCDPLGNQCPGGAACLSAGGDLYVCGLPAATNNMDGFGVLSGGCSLVPGEAPDFGWIAFVALVAGWVVRRRLGERQGR